MCLTGVNNNPPLPPTTLTGVKRASPLPTIITLPDTDDEDLFPSSPSPSPSPSTTSQKRLKQSTTANEKESALKKNKGTIIDLTADDPDLFPPSAAADDDDEKQWKDRKEWNAMVRDDEHAMRNLKYRKTYWTNGKLLFPPNLLKELEIWKEIVLVSPCPVNFEALETVMNMHKEFVHITNRGERYLKSYKALGGWTKREDCNEKVMAKWKRFDELKSKFG